MEILFRGKQTDGYYKWVEGYYVKLIDIESKTPDQHRIYFSASETELDGASRIFYPNYAIIDSATLGQYTGLIDTNGKKIFEGDILEYHTENGRAHKGFVFFKDGLATFACQTLNKSLYIPLLFCRYPLTIIGNIYDNPERQNLKRRKKK